jgi:hypothetical protein
MSITANKALACRFLDLVSAHDVDGLSELIAPTWTMQGGPPGLPAGPEGLRTLFASFGPSSRSGTSRTSSPRATGSSCAP